ncbi:hypothetical protein QTP70_006587 [Hemibagrus guttatus]|uniref:Myeloid-associated differentiation marker-like protein 2 n=1 Tax=Hemibagrus guttatus TaxID=175788 RepID=A0AAE0V393_9TELE|nr:hypothetical protein QTP70_006587 [Hemibagrus guttatus]
MSPSQEVQEPVAEGGVQAQKAQFLNKTWPGMAVASSGSELAFLLHLSCALTDSFKWSSKHFVLKVDVLEAGKMGKHKDLSEFGKGLIEMADDWIRASPKLQLLWGVPSLQWDDDVGAGFYSNRAEATSEPTESQDELIKQVESVVHGAGYSAVYGIFCMAAWSTCFALSAAIFTLDVTRLHSCLPVSWENLTVTLAALSALLYFTASIVYPVYFVRNECPYNDCEVRNFRIAVTVCSWAAFVAYITEVSLSRAKPTRSVSYMSTPSGLLKVLQAYVGCAIFITLANGSEFWRHPATVYCVAVFVLCFAVTVLVVALSVLGRTTFLSLPLDRFVVLYTFAAVLLYVSAAVTWPVFCFDRKYGTPLRPQGCPGGKCAWDSQLVVTVFCFLNLAFYITDLCCSQRARHQQAAHGAFQNQWSEVPVASHSVSLASVCDLRMLRAHISTADLLCESCNRYVAPVLLRPHGLDIMHVCYDIVLIMC